jgi:hypothetical protein
VETLADLILSRVLLGAFPKIWSGQQTTLTDFFNIFIFTSQVEKRILCLPSSKAVGDLS